VPHPPFSKDRDGSIAGAARLLKGSRYAVALTGAGISTASGIPDFRTPGLGLWAEHDPFEVASLSSFRQNPQTFFDWIRPLARRMLAAEPNPAHDALAQLEAMGVLRALITQNFDGLHARAGSQNVYEVHGHIRTATCLGCHRRVPAGDHIRRFVESGDMPRCPVCGEILKPDVILMGEDLPVRMIEGAERAIMRCDVLLVIGTSLEIAPVSHLPLTALARGAHLIIVNNEETYLDGDASVVIRDDVSKVLPALADRLERDQAT
jgi:NAD-dependent deacetylase